jgi:hypothetical protein
MILAKIRISGVGKTKHDIVTVTMHTIVLSGGKAA